MNKEPEKQTEAFVEHEETTPPPKGKKKISLRLDSEGEIQWGEVSGEQKAAIIGGMLTDTDAQSAFRSFLADSATSTSEGFSIDNAKMVLAVFGSIEAIIFHKALKLDKDVAEKCFQFNEEQMNELAPRGSRLVNKWFPDNLKYQDEFLFFGMFLYFTSLQLNAAVQMQQAKHGVVIDAVPATGTVPSAAGNGVGVETLV